MSLDQEARDINNQLCCENKHICELQEKLLTYNEDIEKKADLQIRVGNLQQWIEDLENKMKRANADQMNMIDVQTRKLKKSEEEEAVLRLANNRFIDLNDRMAIQLCALKEREQQFLCEIKKSEKCKQVLENELCNAKETVDELGRAIDRLDKRLGCTEQELCCVQGQADVRHAEHRRLGEACGRAESEAQRTAHELEDARSAAERAREQLECEKRELCTELEAKRTASQCLAERLAETRLTADRERARAAELDERSAEQRRANDQDRRDADAHAQRLNRENRDKEVSVCRMNEQIAELRRDGERTVADGRAVEEQVRATECLLDTAKRAKVGRDGDGGGGGGCDGREQQLERDTDALACDVRRKTKKIVELERQVCCLRSELGAVTAKVACGCPSRCPPPDCSPPRCPPPSCPLPAESLSSIDLSAVFSAKSTCSGGGTDCVSDDDVFINELKQLYCDVENIQKNNNYSCTDT